MKLLTVAFFVLVSSIFGATVPDRVSLEIGLKGAIDGQLSISLKEEVVVVLQFRNLTTKKQRFSIYQFRLAVPFVS